MREKHIAIWLAAALLAASCLGLNEWFNAKYWRKQYDAEKASRKPITLVMNDASPCPSGYLCEFKSAATAASTTGTGPISISSPITITEDAPAVYLLRLDTCPREMAHFVWRNWMNKHPFDVPLCSEETIHRHTKRP